MWINRLKMPVMRPLGISTLRDRICMTATTLVLGPIFDADLPPEQYAYRPGARGISDISVQETSSNAAPYSHSVIIPRVDIDLEECAAQIKQCPTRGSSPDCSRLAVAVTG
jgi:hypothetical protein